MSGKIQLLNTCTCHLVGKIGLNWFIFKLNKCIDYEAHIRYFGQRIKKLSSKVFFCLSYLFAFLIWIYLQNVKLWGKERLLNSNYQYLVKLNLLAQNQNAKKDLKKGLSTMDIPSTQRKTLLKALKQSIPIDQKL